MLTQCKTLENMVPRLLNMHVHVAGKHLLTSLNVVQLYLYRYTFIFIDLHTCTSEENWYCYTLTSLYTYIHCTLHITWHNVTQGLVAMYL